MSAATPSSGCIELLHDIDSERIKLVGAMWMVRDCFDLQSDEAKPHIDEVLGYPPRKSIAAHPSGALTYAYEVVLADSKSLEVELITGMAYRILSTRLDESESIHRPSTAMNMRERVAYMTGLLSRRATRSEAAWKAAKVICAQPVAAFEV